MSKEINIYAPVENGMLAGFLMILFSSFSQRSGLNVLGSFQYLGSLRAVSRFIITQLPLGMVYPPSSASTPGACHSDKGTEHSNKMEN